MRHNSSETKDLISKKQRKQRKRTPETAPLAQCFNGIVSAMAMF